MREFINNLMDYILHMLPSWALWLPLGIMAIIIFASTDNRDDDDNDVSFAAPTERNKNSESSLSVILHQESFFQNMKKSAKTREIQQRINDIEQKIHQLSEEKLKSVRWENYYLPELNSILQQHAKLPISKRKDKDVLDAISAVDRMVTRLVNETQQEAEMALDVDIEVLKKMVQNNSNDEISFGTQATIYEENRDETFRET